MLSLNGKTAIVTGAGSGIGQATAELLARRGVSVVVADINEAAGQRVVQSLRDDGLKVAGVTVDVSDEAQSGRWSTRPSASSAGSTSSTTTPR
jgi:NAD(P)-dependent dehydrogenase (short-subunit alcohol dehydrogenase family)